MELQTVPFVYESRIFKGVCVQRCATGNVIERKYTCVRASTYAELGYCGFLPEKKRRISIHFFEKILLFFTASNFVIYVPIVPISFRLTVIQNAQSFQVIHQPYFLVGFKLCNGYR